MRRYQLRDYPLLSIRRIRPRKELKLFHFSLLRARSSPLTVSKRHRRQLAFVLRMRINGNPESRRVSIGLQTKHSGVARPLRLRQFLPARIRCRRLGTRLGR